MKNNIQLFIFILIIIFSFSFKNKKENAQQYNLKKAGVNYISEKIILSTASPDIYVAEEKRTTIDGVDCIIQDRITYDSLSNIILYETGGSEGFITFSDTAMFTIRHYAKANLTENYIANHNYTNGESRDTIRDFVILENLKMIFSRKDYELFEQQKQMNPKMSRSCLITIYKYK